MVVLRIVLGQVQVVQGLLSIAVNEVQPTKVNEEIN